MKLAFAVLVFALLSAVGSVVHSKEVGRATEGRAQLRLFDERGQCPEQARRVELHIDGTKRFDGCAMALNGNLYVLWEDGDRDVVPLKLIKPGV
jgi:hypothetical protein